MVTGYHVLIKGLWCYHDNVIMVSRFFPEKLHTLAETISRKKRVSLILHLSWRGYHVSMITLSCYHDKVIMIKCYHIFPPENFTHCHREPLQTASTYTWTTVRVLNWNLCLMRPDGMSNSCFRFFLFFLLNTHEKTI
jgi:hypothetical protein